MPDPQPYAAKVILSVSTDTEISPFSISWSGYLIAVQLRTVYQRQRRAYRGITSLADATTVKDAQTADITKNVTRYLLSGGGTDSAGTPVNPEMHPVNTTEPCGEIEIRHVGGTLWEVEVNEWTLQQHIDLPGLATP